MEAQDVQSSF